MRGTNIILFVFALLIVLVDMATDPTCAASSTEKLQYKKQDPSSLTPYLPERLTSSGWSGLSSVWTCALNSLMEFPNPEGFLYNSVTGLCSPLISMVSPSSPGALAVQPTEGDLYLFNHEGRTAKFQLMKLSTGELVCLRLISDIPVTYQAATSFCASLGSYLASVKTLPKFIIISTLANNTKAWVGIDDLFTEGTYVSASDGQLLDSQQIGDVFTPDNWDGQEDCVEFKLGLMLNDIPCWLNRNFICEKNFTHPTTA